MIISTIIGDTLDNNERERYGLFPDVQGFKYALFYLNPDSTLKVKIFYTVRGEININQIPVYKKYSELKKTIEEYSKIKIYLKDGGLLKGKISHKTIDTIWLKTEFMGLLALPLSSIEKISLPGLNNYDTDYESDISDPNQTRAFIMPSANTLRKGNGYIADFELIFFTGAFSITDNLMTNIGFLLLPISLEHQVLFLGLKAKLYEFSQKASIALGWQMLKIPETDEIPNAFYGVCSFGNLDNNRFPCSKFSI